MVSRIPVPEDPPGKTPNPTGLLAMALVVAVALAVWFLSGGDPGTPTGAGEEPPPGRVASSADATPGAPSTDPDSGLAYVELADLPPEAAQTLGLLDSGGPFPYAQDGATFENREGLLPERDLGYYAEFTVETPGSEDRGARRIVVGEGGEEYWSADHYDSFARIRS